MNAIYNNISVTSNTKYMQVADKIRKYIRKGKIRANEQIPNELILSRKFSVSRNTIRDAIAMLINENLLVREQGRGTFVRDSSEDDKTILFLIYKVSNPFNSPFCDDVYRGMKERVADLKYKLEIYEADKDITDIRSFITSLKKRGIAGIILQGKFERKFITETGKLIPLVLTGKILKGYNGYAVVPNQIEAVRTTLKYLFDLGHRRIAYLPSFLHHAGYEEKLDAYTSIYSEMLREHNLEYEPMYEFGEYDTAVRELMKKHNPTAIITCSDNGVHAMNEVKKMGYKIPDDISFMALDDLGRGELSAPAMSVFDIYNEEIGKKSIDCLMQLTENTYNGPNRIDISGELIIRESTGTLK